MSQPAQFNLLPLLSVKPGLTSSREQVGNDLEQYFAAPTTSHEELLNAVTELHRTCGVLRMVSLEGVAVYCDEIERLLQEFTTGRITPTAAHRDLE